MAAAYIGQMAPAGRLVLVAMFHPGRDGPIHRIAYRMAQLRLDQPDFGARALADWQDAPPWRPAAPGAGADAGGVRLVRIVRGAVPVPEAGDGPPDDRAGGPGPGAAGPVSGGVPHVVRRGHALAPRLGRGPGALAGAGVPGQQAPPCAASVESLAARRPAGGGGNRRAVRIRGPGGGGTGAGGASVLAGRPGAGQPISGTPGLDAVDGRTAAGPER